MCWSMSASYVHEFDVVVSDVLGLCVDESGSLRVAVNTPSAYAAALQHSHAPTAQLARTMKICTAQCELTAPHMHSKLMHIIAHHTGWPMPLVPTLQACVFLLSHDV